METFYIHFGSVTYAQKAQKLLMQYNIRNRMSRTSEKGCSYGLDIIADSKAEVLRLFDENGIKYSL